MSGRRLPLIALLALATAGCSMAIPSWVPLLGNKPKPNAEIVEPPKPAPASAPLLSSRDHIEESPDVVDRVVCVVNNDAITQYELDEAELYYLAETRERMSDGEARKALEEVMAITPDPKYAAEHNDAMTKAKKLLEKLDRE